jgi:hypothetical protein
MEGPSCRIVIKAADNLGSFNRYVICNCAGAAPTADAIEISVALQLGLQTGEAGGSLAKDHYLNQWNQIKVGDELTSRSMNPFSPSNR